MAWPNCWVVTLASLPPSALEPMVVLELERRKEHLDLISPTHPLLEVALECLKDKEADRPTTEELCSRLISLKESTVYQESLQQMTSLETMMGEPPPAGDQELQQQLRESEARVENLTREVEQLQLQKEQSKQVVSAPYYTASSKGQTAARER